MKIALPERLSALTAMVLLAILVAMPLRTLLVHFSKESGFLSMIEFGAQFRQRALPEVRELAPPASSRSYDGQFYAQIALRPTLEDRALEAALDNPRYRARRIGLPLLAHVAGLGRPAWILQAYALLNACFWAVLFAALVRFAGWRRPRDILLVFALLGSAGTLSSLASALPDFPAAALGILAILAGRTWVTSAALLSASALVKETSVLSFAAARWRKRDDGGTLRRWVICGTILCLPIAIWVAYVHLRLDGGTFAGHRNFSPPLAGIAQKLSDAVREFLSPVPERTIFGHANLLFEILSPASLVLQAAFLALNARPRCAAWRFGIGFAALLCFVSPNVWVVEANYMRVLLPLTFSFNLVLHRHESGRRYATWYLLGNFGLWSALFHQL